jgi:hypothetical protein
MTAIFALGFDHEARLQRCDAEHEAASPAEARPVASLRQAQAVLGK